MKNSISDLAIFGGNKTFAEPLGFGQGNLPDWDKVVEMFSGVFERHYFSNHGVLAQEIEDKLCEYLNVRNAVTLTNGTIALTYCATALGLKGKVVVPALTHPATVQALSWSGLEPLFCDVDPRTYLITPELVSPILNKHEVSAILAVHLWGNICNTNGFEVVSEKYSIPVFYDAAHAFGCGFDGNMVGSAGAAEIFSLNAENVLNSAEGGLVCTNDDELAIFVRNLRSSYGRRKVVPIPVKGNGRFSELQAGLALLSFDDLENNCINNRNRLHQYISMLSSVDGVEVMVQETQEKHNYQHVVLLINEECYGIDRDTLFRILTAENILLKKYFALGMHRCPPYNLNPLNNFVLPVTEQVSERVLLVPSGQVVTEDCVERVCAIITFSHKNAKEIKKRLYGR
jgi:dTDP-4-amino-4,6-dideoxygalactose transaminase